MSRQVRLYAVSLVILPEIKVINDILPVKCLGNNLTNVLIFISDVRTCLLGLPKESVCKQIILLTVAKVSRASIPHLQLYVLKPVLVESVEFFLSHNMMSVF